MKFPEILHRLWLFAAICVFVVLIWVMRVLSDADLGLQNSLDIRQRINLSQIKQQRQVQHNLREY